MIEVYTDGGSVPNPGYGAWGYVVVMDGEAVHTQSDKEKISTSNKMELTAVIEALKHLKSRGIVHNITVYIDSKYVQKGITEWIYTWLSNGWKTSNKKPVKNRSLWESLYSLKENDFISLQIKWVKGHNGNKFNEMADDLCTQQLHSVYGEFDYEKDKESLKKFYKDLISRND